MVASAYPVEGESAIVADPVLQILAGVGTVIDAGITVTTVVAVAVQPSALFTAVAVYVVFPAVAVLALTDDAFVNAIYEVLSVNNKLPVGVQTIES